MKIASTVALIIFSICIVGNVASAQYKITTSLPGTDILMGKNASDFTIPQYINELYRGAVAIVGAFALIMIIFHGTKWAMSAGNPSKINDAKDGILQAIIGIVLLLGAYVILNTINPELVTLDIPTVDQVGNIAPNYLTPASGGGVNSQLPPGCAATDSVSPNDWHCGTPVRCSSLSACQAHCQPLGRGCVTGTL